MSATTDRPSVSSHELVAISIAADGGETFTVTLPKPAVDYIRRMSGLLGCTQAAWLFQAILRQAEHQSDEARRALRHRRSAERHQDVDLGGDGATTPVIDAIDGLVNWRVAAAHDAGDDREVDRLGVRKLAFKREVEKLSPMERNGAAERFLSGLLAEGRR